MQPSYYLLQLPTFSDLILCYKYIFISSLLITIIAAYFNVDLYVRRVYAMLLVYIARIVFNVKTRQGDKALYSLLYGGTEYFRKRYPKFYNKFENGISNLGLDQVSEMVEMTENARGNAPTSNFPTDVNLSTPTKCKFPGKSQETKEKWLKSPGEISSNHLLRSSKRATRISESASEISLSLSKNKNIEIPKLNLLQDITNELTSEAQICISAIADDQITKRFQAQHLSSWNLMSRAEDPNSGRNLYNSNWKVFFAYWIGFLIRYCILLPFRFVVSIFVALPSMGLAAFLLNSKIPEVIYNKLYSTGSLKKNEDLKIKSFSTWKRELSQACNLICMRIMKRGLGMIINFHNHHNRPSDGTVLVANHTTVLDMIVLMTDRTYSTIGQKHQGIIGFVQKSLNSLTSNIWFDRSNLSDRQNVVDLIKQHIFAKEKDNDPIMLFPEGTCINNTSVMRFNKGSFQIENATFHPVAIKYNAYFGEAFWNSSKYSMLHYLLRIFTSWCIVCDVFYLDPVKKTGNISATELAQKCQIDIAKQISVDCFYQFDGGLKRKQIGRRAQKENFEKHQRIISQKIFSAEKIEEIMNEPEQNEGEEDESIGSSTDTQELLREDFQQNILL